MSQAMRTRKIRLGDDILTYCGRCKAERTHVVAALKTDTEPAEVICRTCQSKHRFRAPRAERTATAGERTTRVRATRPKAFEVPPEVAAGRVRAYSPREAYAEGEWIAHTTFGHGQVAAVRAGKIDVRFESGARTLVHAG
jgi:hypothetical protein